MRATLSLALLLSISLISCGQSVNFKTIPRIANPCLQPASNLSETISITTSRGAETEAIIERSDGEFSRSNYGFLFLTGVDGGFLEPVEDESTGIYKRVADWAIKQGSESVFVKFRNPGGIEDSVEDALAGAQYLKNRGVSKFIVMGWSFGGAVMIHTAVLLNDVVLGVGFAPQALDTEPVAEFSRQKLLLIHSYDDENVPYESSTDILARAPESIEKTLVSTIGATHNLQGYKDEIDPVIFEWINKVRPEQETRC